MSLDYASKIGYIWTQGFCLFQLFVLWQGVPIVVPNSIYKICIKTEISTNKASDWNTFGLSGLGIIYLDHPSSHDA
jgi:hypothetical protein